MRHRNVGIVCYRETEVSDALPIAEIDKLNSLKNIDVASAALGDEKRDYLCCFPRIEGHRTVFFA
jgi:hypothetical protein